MTPNFNKKTLFQNVSSTKTTQKKIFKKKKKHTNNNRSEIKNREQKSQHHSLHGVILNISLNRQHKICLIIFEKIDNPLHFGGVVAGDREEVKTDEQDFGVGEDDQNVVYFVGD